ncbi:MAG: hypothetical protein ACJ789_08140 [Thermomicrobiales bacterium]
MQRLNRLWVAGLMVAAVFALVPAMASAHEHRDVAGGKYSMVVGFLDEPAFTTVKNGLDLRVSATTGGTPTPTSDEEVEGTPVEGLEKTLKAEVIYGDQKMDLTLEPAFGAPGAYEAWFFPMAAGDYSFHIYGDIEGTAIDETFTSSPEGFSSVIDRAQYEFPKASGSTSTGNAIGSVTTGGGADGAGMLIGGMLLAVIAGASGLLVVQRALSARRQTSRRPAVARADAKL